MRYLSVCSGIEAATVAWEPLGWSAFAFSEIEPFPCKVLAHHYPDVPNFGDMTKFKEWPDANVDVLVGGTPCQSFSIAGLRKGLDDPRGNLMLTYLAIAAKYRPKWVLWENVAGVLSSNGGRDFATFLRGLAECGYGYAYRVLDAQYVRTDGYPYAVPQRRRRVFVVGCVGNWRSAAAVLFDSESMSGNPAPSRKKGQDVTEVAGTLSANGGGTTRPAGNANELDFCITTNRMAGFGGYVDDDVAGSLKQRDYKDATDLISYGIAGNTISRQPENGGNGLGYSEDVSYTLTKTDQHAVAFGVGENPDLAHCLRSGASKADKHESTTYIAQSVTAFKVRGGCDGGGKGYLGSEDAAFTLSTNQDQYLAQPIVLMDQGGSVMNVNTDGTVGTLRRETHGHEPIILQKMQVRRLTPLECHRLQGFPDHYLHQVKGATDSAMYKALGNSMAVNCMSLLGQRIQMVNELQAEREAA